jgi:DNA uptake protein ComE-like DNA-binding protein
LGGWYDNASYFQGVAVVKDDDPARRARFTIIAPRIDSEGIASGGIRFGLENESCRINLNSIKTDQGAEKTSQQILMALPGMTEEIADAILDWIDPDDEPRANGAESEYYSTLDPPYAPKNGPLDTVEELLLVRGVTPGLLFGCDLNRNGQIDPGEPGPQSLPDVDNSDGSMNQGWAAYFTLHSLEKNLQSTGQPKININGDDMQKLYNDLQPVIGDEWATYIVAYRQNGNYTGKNKSKALVAGQLDFSKKGSTNLTTILDLIDTKVQVQFKGDKQPTVFDSPFSSKTLAANTYLTKIMDALATDDSPTIPGRININLASKVVLMSIPGMTDDLAAKIIANRTMDPKDADTGHQYPTWIMAEGLVTLDQMKKFLPYITCGGDVYRVQAIGYFDDGGPAARIEAIIDASNQPVRVLFWRDITHLGRGYALETLGTESQ